MSKWSRLAPLGIIVAALVLILMLGRNFFDSRLPVISSSYYKSFKSSAELEMKYSQKGPYDVKDYAMDSGDESMGEITVWYPSVSEGEKVPMIIVVNPTMVTQVKYKAFFSRLASWGFVVVGNEDPQTGRGESTSVTLDAMLGLVETHPLRDVIDYDKIGIVGYSQGGSGALAAVTEYENGSNYKAIFTGSAAYPELSESMGWKYDLSKINIPYFMCAGTGQNDDAGLDKSSEDYQGAAPLWSLEESYDAVPGTAMKIRARASGADHSDMLLKSDGYMTAWMLYNLRGDQEAAKAFVGSGAEILNNSNWQDIEKNQ